MSTSALDETNGEEHLLYDGNNPAYAGGEVSGMAFATFRPATAAGVKYPPLAQ